MIQYIVALILIKTPPKKVVTGFFRGFALSNIIGFGFKVSQCYNIRKSFQHSKQVRTRPGPEKEVRLISGQRILFLSNAP